MRPPQPRGDRQPDTEAGLLVPNTKLPIPRLPRQERLPPKTPARQRDRVLRACRNCHRRKIKCSGGLPRCDYCKKSNRKCVYDSSRRDKLASANGRNERLISLLRNLCDRVTEEDRNLIEQTLQDSDDEGSPVPTQSEDSSRTFQHSTTTKQESRPETPQSFRFGQLKEPSSFTGLPPDQWPYSTEHKPYNLNRESSFDLQDNENEAGASDEKGTRSIRGDAAYIGQICEAHWLLHLQNRVVNQADKGHMMPLSELDFYLDHRGVHMSDPGNPFHLPDEMSARVLYQCYHKTVQRAFPGLSTGLDNQLQSYYQSIRNQQGMNLPQSWYAVANLVFAIGSRFCRLTKDEWQHNQLDESLYVARAYQLLGFNETAIVLSDPDFSLTQATGLLAFYFMAIGHVNRAWIMISTALRFALSLGLHSPDRRSSIDTLQKQAMSQTWWTLHNIESLLCSITGRPCMLQNEAICTPYPCDFLAEQAEAESDEAPTMVFQDAQVRLAMFSQQILARLYTDPREIPSWESTHDTMTELMTSLDDWAIEAMPRRLELETDPGLDRLQLLLRKHYYRLKILITRPSLQRIEQCYNSGTENITAFDRTAAEICISTSQDVVALLPDEIDLSRLYERGPWWTIVHNFMQAAAVLLISISLRSIFPSMLDPSLTSFRKLTMWLQAMCDANDVAENAYKVLYNVVTSVPTSTWPEILDVFPDDLVPQQYRNIGVIEAMNQMYLPWQG